MALANYLDHSLSPALPPAIFNSTFSIRDIPTFPCLASIAVSSTCLHIKSSTFFSTGGRELAHDMRLKIRTLGGDVERISVPDGVTLSELRQQITGQLPRFVGDELKLSLNKQVQAAEISLLSTNM